MNLFESGALPMGMLMFAIMVGGALRKRAGYAIAKAQYPKLAQELGLTYRESRYSSGVGRLEGIRDGFMVTVDPDDQRWVRLGLPRPPGLELWNHQHNRRPPPGMVGFRPALPAAARFLRTAQGTPEAIERFNRARELESLFARLGRMRPLKSFSVTERGITAVFDFGSPPFIPADVVRSLVPDLVALGKALGAPLDGASTS